jgi:hypothetical protein
VGQAVRWLLLDFSIYLLEDRGESRIERGVTMSDELAVPDSNMPAEQPASTQPAPTAAGIVPDMPIMRKQTYSSTMSYIGITRRSTAWLRSFGTTPFKTGLGVLALIVFLAGMYAFLVVWYFVIFVIFGVLTFPFRLIRRSHRKQEHFQKQQLATMQAMLVQQQQALQQNQPKADE